MASKVTRTALVAASVVGASGILAVSAEAAPPTIPTALVNQPAVSAATSITPESAVLNGVVDTGGNPQSTFSLPANTTLTWAGSFNLINTGSSAVTERVEGIPSDLSSVLYGTSSASTTINNGGADNYSTVLFEYDPASDYANNGNNPGPETGFANEVNVSTYPGLSQVSVKVGQYPVGDGSGFGGSLSGPLTPGTKYDYWIVQQAGATDAGETVNTYGQTTASNGTNPTWTCYPDSYIAAVAPFNSYTTTGTVSGGVNGSGTAQTTPQPQIQGPCVYYYGGGSNYYDSYPGTFTTPSLGTVKFANAVIKSTDKISNKVVGTKKVNGKTVKVTKKIITLTNISANVSVLNQSVEPTKGSIALTYNGKAVGSAKYTVAAQATKGVALSLTSFGKSIIASGKKVSVKVGYTTTTDQPQGTKSITL